MQIKTESRSKVYHWWLEDCSKDSPITLKQMLMSRTDSTCPKSVRSTRSCTWTPTYRDTCSWLTEHMHLPIVTQRSPHVWGQHLCPAPQLPSPKHLGWYIHPYNVPGGSVGHTSGRRNVDIAWLRPDTQGTFGLRLIYTRFTDAYITKKSKVKSSLFISLTFYYFLWICISKRDFSLPWFMVKKVHVSWRQYR